MPKLLRAVVAELAAAAVMDSLKRRMKRDVHPGDPTWFFFLRGELAVGNYAVLITRSADVFVWDTHRLFKERRRRKMLKNILSHLKQNADGKPKRNPVTTPYRYQINAEECRSCVKCKKVCKAGAIRGERGKSYVIDEQKCIKCGTCMKWCKYKAIKRLDMY